MNVKSLVIVLLCFDTIGFARGQTVDGCEISDFMHLSILLKCKQYSDARKTEETSRLNLSSPDIGSMVVVFYPTRSNKLVDLSWLEQKFEFVNELENVPFFQVNYNNFAGFNISSPTAQ